MDNKPHIYKLVNYFLVDISNSQEIRFDYEELNLALMNPEEAEKIAKIAQLQAYGIYQYLLSPSGYQQFNGVRVYVSPIVLEWEKKYMNKNKSII